jgi:hypothetical protein
MTDHYVDPDRDCQKLLDRERALQATCPVDDHATRQPAALTRNKAKVVPVSRDRLRDRLHHVAS